jgi:hypothetical protein
MLSVRYYYNLKVVLSSPIFWEARLVQWIRGIWLMLLFAYCDQIRADTLLSQ